MLQRQRKLLQMILVKRTRKFDFLLRFKTSKGLHIIKNCVSPNIESKMPSTITYSYSKLDFLILNQSFCRSFFLTGKSMFSMSKIPASKKNGFGVDE